MRPYARWVESNEVIKRRRMVHAFTAEPLAPGTAERLLRAAVDEQLGAVFFGPPDIADFRTRFGVPDEWTPIGAIAAGHSPISASSDCGTPEEKSHCCFPCGSPTLPA
jgi:hypothetical protein